MHSKTTAHLPSHISIHLLAPPSPVSTSTHFTSSKNSPTTEPTQIPSPKTTHHRLLHATGSTGAIHTIPISLLSSLLMNRAYCPRPSPQLSHSLGPTLYASSHTPRSLDLLAGTTHAHWGPQRLLYAGRPAWGPWNNQ